MCVKEPNPFRNRAFRGRHVVGETIGLIPDRDIKSILSLIEYWFSQPYSYDSQQCNAGSDRNQEFDTCDDYLEVRSYNVRHKFERDSILC